MADRLSPDLELEILTLTKQGQGSWAIARLLGVGRTSVIRVRRRKIRERNALVEAHLDLAVNIARNVGRDIPPHMRADLLGVANIALIEAAGNYRPDVQGDGHSKPVSFGAFARQRIRGACIDSIRRRHWVNGNSNELTAAESESRVDAHAPTAEASVIDRQARIQQREKLTRAILSLPGRLAVVTWLHHFEGRTIDQVAAQFGVVPSRVSQLHTEALGMMREVLRR